MRIADGDNPLDATSVHPESYEAAKKLLSGHRKALDKIAAFLIEKETITGKEFMEIFHEVEGIEPEEKKEKTQERIAMNPVETEEDVSEEDVSEENI